jgi:Lon-like protease
MKKTLAVLAVLAIALAAVVVPLPLLVVSGGEPISVPAHITVEDELDEINGDLLLTTVHLRRANAVGALEAVIDPNRDVLRRQEVIPPDIDDEEFVAVQQRLFEETGRIAIAVGAEAAGVDVEVSGTGAEVAGVVDGGPADGHLRPGDVIVAVDGTPVELAADLVAATAEADEGDTVALTVVRDDEEQRVEVQLAVVSELERPALGIAVRTLELDIEVPVDIEIDVDRVGGPSAGLMIALSTYDLLSDEDLAAGRVIAGTGTVDGGGNVGSVGGVPHKVRAARQHGAEVFVVGEGEADEAEAAAGEGITVVGVTTLDEALRALADAPSAP